LSNSGGVTKKYWLEPTVLPSSAAEGYTPGCRASQLQ
jgi:hypothetical protein